MGILQRGMEAWIGDAPEVVVLGVEGPEGLMAGTPIALGLEAGGHRVSLIEADPGARGLEVVAAEDPSWAGAVAEWYAEQGRPVTVARWGGDPDALPGGPVIVTGGAALLDPPAPVRERLGGLHGRPAVAALCGLGAEQAEGEAPDVAHGRLTELSAVGAILAVEAVPRFETVGRHFVELVEHVHHRAGPAAQSRVADTLRASLFGRHGDHPVSLATVDRTPRVGVLATLVWFVDLRELIGGR